MISTHATVLPSPGRCPIPAFGSLVQHLQLALPLSLLLTPYLNWQTGPSAGACRAFWRACPRALLGLGSICGTFPPRDNPSLREDCPASGPLRPVPVRATGISTMTRFQTLQFISQFLLAYAFSPLYCIVLVSVPSTPYHHEASFIFLWIWILCMHTLQAGLHMYFLRRASWVSQAAEGSR